MSQQPQVDSAENLGHFHHRDEISEMTAKDAPDGNMAAEDMFRKAKEHAETMTSKNQYFSKEEQQKDIDLQGNIVGIIGHAGIGKTTLAKTILKQTIDENLFDAEYVFYLQFRDIDYEKETNLLSFISKSAELLWIQDKQRRNAVLNKLSACKNTVLIMDGLDEAFIDFSSQFIHTANLHDISKPESFIKNILHGNVLPKAKKLVTSRPRQLLELPTEIRPKFIVNILGLGLEAQYQICKDICDENTDYVFNYIQQQAPIASYCYVPANCILVMQSINNLTDQHSKARQVSLPNTITGILAIVICLFVTSPHVRIACSKFPLEKFAQLAWEGFQNKKICFDESDLLSAGLTNEELNLFLVTTLTKDSLTFLGGDPKKVSYFAHLLIQEFFVALALIFFMPFKKFKQLVAGKYVGSVQLSKPTIDLTEGSWEMVAKFLFGLCNTAAVSCLKEKFPNLFSKASDKTNLICEFALRKMPDRFSNPTHYFRDILRVCTWAYELNDNNFAEQIAKRLKKEITITGTIIPSDITPFCYVLRQRKVAISIDTTQLNTWFVGDSLLLFLDKMEQMSLNSSVSVMLMLQY